MIIYKKKNRMAKHF